MQGQQSCNELAGKGSANWSKKEFWPFFLEVFTEKISCLFDHNLGTENVKQMHINLVTYAWAHSEEKHATYMQGQNSPSTAEL